MHAVVAQRTRRLITREIERRTDAHVVLPFLHILHLGAGDILVETHRRFARRDGVEDVVASDHVFRFTGFFYLVHTRPAQVVTQAVVRMFLMLVEGVEEGELTFRTQVLGAERRIRAEIDVRMQVGCAHAAKTQTHAL